VNFFESEIKCLLLCRSFAPFWQVMKTFAEKLSNLHQQLMTSWQDIVRDVHKYSTEQQKKHKEVSLTILTLQFMEFI